MTKTIDYYDRNAQHYTAVNHTSSAASVDLLAFVDRLEPLRTASRPLRVLDAGSGSGRDTLALLGMGIEVDAFDGSKSMTEQSSRLTGLSTRVMCFEALDLPPEHYDGIWAMASLLHVERDQLPKAIIDLGASLRPEGVLFASFKYGASDRVDTRDGRAFTDFNEDEVTRLLSGMEGWELLATTMREASPNQANQEPWFSFTLQRTGPAPRLLPEMDTVVPPAKSIGFGP
jgi:SAM-dependent methyltransferase